MKLLIAVRIVFVEVEHSKTHDQAGFLNTDEGLVHIRGL